MRPYWVWVGPKFIRTGVLKRKGKLGHRDTDAQGRGHGQAGAEVGSGASTS